jgi:diguanylate cyclase (GGDEF)-like protein
MASTCRAGDVAARIGGDEFAVLAKSPSASDLHAMRERLQAALTEPIPTQAGQLTVGVSCGLAVVSGQDLAESVLARADAAMYADKRGRKAQRSTGSEG